MRPIALCLLLAAFVGSTTVHTAHAEASLPWTPSAFERHRLALLVDEAGLSLPLSQWPLPSAAVVHALNALPTDLPPALAAARADLLADLHQDEAAAQATLSLRNPRASLVGFGDDAAEGSSFALQTARLGSGPVAARFGGRIEQRVDPSGTLTGDHGSVALRAEGSAVAVEAMGVQLQAWSDRKWWGPGWQSSLILGNNAPALTGASLQRASGSRSESPWLAWLGAWNAEVFAARLEHVDQPAHPYLLGMRITLRPFDTLEIGVSRTAQWGGRGRLMTGRSLLNTLIGKDVNPDTPAQAVNDPANELAGFDARLRCPSAWHCAAYGQYIGEDEAGHLPSKYLGLYGLELWSPDGLQRGYAEVAETGCRMPIGRSGVKGCAYRNQAYPGGYVQDGRWLGAGVGPDSRLLTLGWMNAAAFAGTTTTLRLHVGRVGSRIADFSSIVDDPDNSGRLIGIAANAETRWNKIVIAPELSLIRIAATTGTRNDARIGLTLRTSLGAEESR